MTYKIGLCILIMLSLVAIVRGQDRTQIRATATALIDGVKYEAICYSDEKIVINNAAGKTLLTLKDEASGFYSLAFKDFDGDGYKDLRIEYMTNVPGICDVVLYDKGSRRFVKIDGLDRYPDPNRLAGTKIYYSYHRAGCADMNWVSDLFVIKNFKPVKMGTIGGYECADSGIKDGIYVYQVSYDNKVLYDQLPINTINKYKNYKWGFIKTYWRKHYKEFSSPLTR